MGILWWLIIGLIAGGLARLIVPGQQPMGLVLTMVLGLIGSVVGGLIAWGVFGNDPMAPGLHVGGLFMSVVGAVIVLAVYVGFVQRRVS